MANDLRNICFEEIKAITLDLGNTLISVNYNIINNVLKKNGVYSDLKNIKIAEASARVALSQRISEGVSGESSDAFWTYWSYTLHYVTMGNLKEKTIENIINKIRNISTINLWSSLIPGVKKALDTFSNQRLKLIVISNSDGTAEQQLIQRGIRDYFLGVIDSSIVKLEKPNPEIFKLAIENYNLTPETTLHIGDIYSVDIIGAHRANMYAILLDPYSFWNNVECPKCKDLLEVSKYF